MDFVLYFNRVHRALFSQLSKQREWGKCFSLPLFLQFKELLLLNDASDVPKSKKLYYCQQKPVRFCKCPVHKCQGPVWINKWQLLRACYMQTSVLTIIDLMSHEVASTSWMTVFRSLVEWWCRYEQQTFVLYKISTCGWTSPVGGWLLQLNNVNLNPYYALLWFEG